MDEFSSMLSQNSSSECTRQLHLLSEQTQISRSQVPQPGKFLIKPGSANLIRKILQNCDPASVPPHLFLISSELLMATKSYSGTLALERVEAH